MAERISKRYAERMSPQIAVRLDQDLADRLDALVADGRFDTKADAIRTAIEALVDVERRRRIGEAIVEGYRRVPPGDDPGLEASLDRALHDLLGDLEAQERDRGVPW
jgi:Arc/MetJ-type ribon-helix-helix transcriptional regulator